MQPSPAETPPPPASLSAPDFRHVRNSLAYNDLHAIRDELSGFLQQKGVMKTYRDNLQFTLTEILSNLVKHPARKADYIEIRASLAEDQVEMEVLDNSTPFANFNAKCKLALSNPHTAATGAECGYGLGCILALHKNPQYTPTEVSPDGLNHFKIIQDTPMMQEIPPQEKQGKIFLVDDDPISLRIHHRMLEEAYDVAAFEKAEDALSAFMEIKPNLIISDLTMPGMDGMSLRKALMEMDGGNTTPFIFLSGSHDNENNPYISHLGVDDFLCKPVSRERLHAVLTRLLRRSQQIRAGLLGQFSHDLTTLLTPSLPESYGAWRFAVRHVVAEAGGGDFILHHTTETNMMVVLADVMGHGRQAKFFSYVYAGYLRSMFRMYAGSLDTAHFLKHLSQSVEGDPLLESMIMTCQCFQFLDAGLLKVSSAGHPRPILLHRRGGGELIDVMGPLPGLVGDTVYDMKSVRLGPGDKILFMTDGFMETFDRSAAAAEAMLKRVRDAPASSATQLADHLWEAYGSQLQQQLNHRDDATIIVAEYGAPS